MGTSYTVVGGWYQVGIGYKTSASGKPTSAKFYLGKEQDGVQKACRVEMLICEKWEELKSAGYTAWTDEAFAEAKTFKNSTPQPQTTPEQTSKGVKGDLRRVAPQGLGSSRMMQAMGNAPADVWIGSIIDQTGAILTANAADFLCEHLTLDDQSTANDGQARSAIALGAARQTVEDCEIKGKHNAVSIRGGTEAYLHCCSITGTGDIVYGAGTAYFDTCDVMVVEPAGTIATPRTPKEVPVGFVFVDCRVTGSSSAKPSLMRPWSADGATAFIRCSMDKYISRQGWSPWDGREMTCRAEEFGSITTEDQPLDMSKRPAWVHRLSAEQAASYTLANVYPDWSPQPHISN